MAVNETLKSETEKRPRLLAFSPRPRPSLNETETLFETLHLHIRAQLQALSTNQSLSDWSVCLYDLGLLLQQLEHPG